MHDPSQVTRVAAKVTPLIAHPVLRRLHDYWRGLPCGRCGAPLRAAFDPAAIGYCLPHVGLAEIETPFRVRYRLVGSALERLYGGPLAGRYVDELYTPAVRAHVLAAYRRVIDEVAADYALPSLWLRAVGLGYHRLMLPLSRSGESVDLVVVAIYPADRGLRAAWQWRPFALLRGWLGRENNPPQEWTDPTSR
jgi:hypothetical protein